MQTIFRKKLLFILIAIIGVSLVAWQLFHTQNLHISRENLDTFLLFGAIAIGFQMTGHWIRAVKHKYLLEQIRPIRTQEVFKGQMIGFLFNTILPFRLGELVRAHYIGKGVSISRSAVFATIVFERLLDTVIIILIGSFLITQIEITPPALTKATALLALIILVFSLGLRAAYMQKGWLLKAVHSVSSIFNEPLKNRIRMVFWSAIYCLKNVVKWQRMPRYIALTGTMWIFYLLSAFIFITTLLPTIPLAKQLITSLGVYFGVSVPSGPAYLGTFQEIFTSISGVSTQLLDEVNAPFALWLLLIVPTTVLGFTFLLRKQRIYNPQTDDVLDVLKNKLYRDADISKEFAHFLDAYFKGDKINRILTAEELANNFQVIKTFKGGSNALTILAWQGETMVVKKITLKQYEEKLRAQYLWLQDYQKLPSVTKVLQEYRNHPDFYAIDIEYRDQYIPFFDFIHSSSTQMSRKILLEVCEFVNSHIYTNQKPLSGADKVLRKYIRTKAIGKITDAANANLPIAHLLTYDTLIVNGREVQNFHAILEKIQNHPQAMADLTNVLECPIQGDLTIDNLMVNPTDNTFMILDPNNENAISDPIVDYAKLMQSVHSGYEFLYYLNNCTVRDNKINFEERRSAQYNSLYRSLSNHLKEELPMGRYRAILFHEAVHYCRMLTYRVGINPNTAAAFYAVAVRLFNDFMEQYDDEAKS